MRFAQSYILGRLRNVTFFSLAECNAAIAVAVERMNSRVMRRLGISRRQLFEAIERPAMQALPREDFEYAEWHLARVGIDYHVEIAGFFYSVPHALIREQVDTRATQRTIEVFHHGRRVAAHPRRYGGPRHGTQVEHMPSAHRRYAEWTPERLQRDARAIGPATEGLIIAVMARRPHPEQGFRTCLGILLEHESTLRQQKRFDSRAKNAKLRHLAAVEDVDYRTPRGLDRAMFLKLASCDWIRQRRHCLLTGPSGVGKSWLACALGYKACRENLSVYCNRCGGDIWLVTGGYDPLVA